MANKAKKILDRFWFILWKDDSWKGWILSIVVLFIFIKWIFFPILSLTTGTILPIAIVESCSMYHDNGITHEYENWWDYKETGYEKFDITKENFSEFIFKNGFNKGDVLFIIKANPDKLKIGEVIIFQATTTNPVIHRIVRIQEKEGKKIFSTMGDNNIQQLYPGNNPYNINEKEITEDQLVGKAIAKVVPYAGWLKLIFYEKYREPSQKGLCYRN